MGSTKIEIKRQTSEQDDETLIFNYKYFSEDWQDELENIFGIMMIGERSYYTSIEDMRRSFVVLFTQSQIEQGLIQGASTQQGMRDLLLGYGPNGMRVDSESLNNYLTGSSINFFYRQDKDEIRQLGGNYVFSLHADMTNITAGGSERLQLHINHRRGVSIWDKAPTRIIVVKDNFTRINEYSSKLVVKVKKIENIYLQDTGMIGERSETVYEKEITEMPDLVYSFKIGIAFTPTYFEGKSSNKFEFNHGSGERMAFIAYSFFGVLGLGDTTYETTFVSPFFDIKYAYRVKENEEYSFGLRGNSHDELNSESQIYLEEYICFGGRVVEERIFYDGKEALFGQDYGDEIKIYNTNPYCFHRYQIACLMCKKKKNGRFLYTSKFSCYECTRNLNVCSQCFNNIVCQKCKESDYFTDPFRRGQCRAFSERCPHGKGAYSPLLGNIISPEFQDYCLTCPLNCKNCFDFQNTQALCSECFQAPGIAEIQQDGTCKCLKSNCQLCERYDCDKCIDSRNIILIMKSGGSPGGDNPSFICRDKEGSGTCGTNNNVPSAFSATDLDEKFFCYNPDLSGCNFIVGNRCDMSVTEGVGRSIVLTGTDLDNPIKINEGKFSNCNTNAHKYLTYHLGGNLNCYRLSENELGNIGCLVKNLTNDCQTCEGEGTPIRLDSMRYGCGCPLGKFYNDKLSSCDTCLDNCKEII